MGKCVSKNTIEDEIETVETSHLIQDFTLVWLDAKIDEKHADFRHSLIQLRRIVNTVHTFTDLQQCLKYLHETKYEKFVLILSGVLVQSTVPIVHELPQLDSIYIFCKNQSKYQQWASVLTKIKGVFTRIEDICTAIKTDTQEYNEDSLQINVTSKDLNCLDASFMYTQLLKEILFEIDYDDDNAKHELVEFCRKQFQKNPKELQIIDEFEQDYHIHTPIWWYTRECFTYQLLNRALRIQDVEVIIKMGFFLRDVHRHLQELHSKLDRNQLITVYRGKTMSNDEFNEIRTKENGLLAFNTFLSTSVNEQVSLQFAKKSLTKPNTVAVLFQMTIDPSISSTPFAPISSVSAIPNEEEILFSMHTVFRIGRITEIQERIWRVDLTLTSDDDEDLKQLTEYMRQKSVDSTKWEQLGQLLIIMGNFNKAEEIYRFLLQETFKNDEKTQCSLYYHLGDVKNHQGEHVEALKCYQKSLELRQNHSDLKSVDLMNNYSGIGTVYGTLGNYSTALEFHQKALESAEKLPPQDQVYSAEICQKIAALYTHMGNSEKSAEFYRKSLDICLQPLSSNPTTTDNSAMQNYQIMSFYFRSILAYQKILEHQQKILPPNHPDLACIYNSLGLLHSQAAVNSSALDCFQKELKIKERSLSPNHPDFAAVYNNLAMTYSKLNDFGTALEYYQKALNIYSKSLPSNHLNVATAHNNIGLLYVEMGQSTEALEHLEKALRIKEEQLPANHEEIFTVCANLGLMYWHMGDFVKSLEYYERVVDIGTHAHLEYHPALASAFNTVGLLCFQLGNHSKSLENFEKALELKKTFLPDDHPDLANMYNHIGLVYFTMENYLKALECYKYAVDIGQRCLPQDHPVLQAYQLYLAEVEKRCDAT